MKPFWENKNVTAYVALKHHTRFIIPIMEQLAAMGAQTNYLVAQAERSQEITAIEMNLGYSHIFDYLDDSDTDDIYKNYHILRTGFACSLLKDNIFSLQVPTVLDKTLFATAQEYIAFKNYFEQEKVDVCIALHETNRWGKIFGYHAKRKGIPFITFQEGLYSTASAYHDFELTGHAQYSTLNLVWGEKTREKLASYEAPQAKIIPAGNTHITDEINRLTRYHIRETKRSEHQCTDGFVGLLLFSINLIPINELMPLLDVFGKNDQFHLYMKFHPATVRIDINKWIEKIPEEKKKGVWFIHGEENIYDLMAMSDLCILIEGSTTGLEALAIGKPIVELDLQTKITYDFSLAKENAAIKMNPAQLAQAIENQTDFLSLMDQTGVQTYLESELFESEKSIENVTRILESVVAAKDSKTREPLADGSQQTMKWSIILPLIENPDLLLSLLETLSIHSDGELYEVILIRPKVVSKQIDTILNSLEGDILILTMTDQSSLPDMMNIAACNARGKYLLFCDKSLVPKKNWLTELEKGFALHGNKKMFGAKIINRFNNIVHAGMVVDVNNCPVCAYLHLDKDFPHTCKARSFQMVDHFAAIEKQLFLSSAGFSPQSGKYLFLDLSLTLERYLSDPRCIVYLPDVEFVRITSDPANKDLQDAIFFYSKWHSLLWESEKKLYDMDGVSELQLSAARMTRAMETAHTK
ncbi:MAG: hypothetical protein ABIJ31_01685 [Pseudomonadota bacterium]